MHHVGPSHPSLSVHKRTEAACCSITSEQTHSLHSTLTQATCFSETSELPSVLTQCANPEDYHLAKFFAFLNLKTLTLKLYTSSSFHNYFLETLWELL